MKVCMISGAFPEMRCGIGDYAARLVMQLAEHGVHVDVLARRDQRVAAGTHPAVRVFPKLSSIPALDARAIARHFRAHQCDVIHIQYPTWPFRRSLSISFLPAALGLLGAGPVLTTIHEVARCHPINRLRLIPMVYTSAASSATTYEDCRWLTDRLPGIGGRVFHIPIGANIEPRNDAGASGAAGARDEYRRRLGIAKAETAMCYFGFALRNKLIDDLLAAFRSALDAGARMRLVFMTGLEKSEGSYPAEILQLIETLRLGDHIVHTGFLPPDEVTRCFAACDFAALLFRDGASFRRGSILAAMAHGLPVLSCRSGAPPKGLEHGENILLPEAGDVPGLAQNMVELCNDPILRRRLHRASLATAEQFAWPLIAERTVALYRRILQ
ncbi:MAG: glycosyltransferase family 4 protein [Planctomycetes bacterium]|nr:glycosyltransferase family 4 protein [Planctomycetota bacterium]